MAKGIWSIRSGVIGICIWLFATTGPANSDEPDYAASGIYIGAGASFAWDNFEKHLNDDRDMAFGGGGWVGYRFLQHFAAELQVEYLDGFDGISASLIVPDIIIGGPGGFLGSVKSELQMVTFTGNLKAFLPLGRFQPNILAGVGLGYIEMKRPAGLFVSRKTTSDTALAARFGGGFDFYLTSALAIQISSSYVLQTEDLDGYDYVSLVAGLQYRF